MNLIFVFALLGLIFGQLPGLIVGALIGYGLSRMLATAIKSGFQQTQSSFLDVTFSVMGALSKADGVVSPAEIQSTQRIFDMLRLSPAQREQAKASFNRGKSPGFDLDAEIDRLRVAVNFGRGPLLRLFLQLQCMTVAADGQIHQSEHAMLVRIARRLGLTERDVAQLEALLRAATASGAGGRQPGAPPSRSQLDDAYTALGVTPSATDAEIKRAYRKLVSENHPDRLASKGLPDSMREVAEERTREINVAYDLIKESRGFK